VISTEITVNSREVDMLHVNCNVVLMINKVSCILCETYFIVGLAEKTMS